MKFYSNTNTRRCHRWLVTTQVLRLKVIQEISCDTWSHHLNVLIYLMVHDMVAPCRSYDEGKAAQPAALPLPEL
jgi:hypothetical protein